MSLDDRAADRQPDAHASLLGRVESIEQFVETLTIEAYAGISDRDANVRGPVRYGTDHQPPGTIVDVQHRLGGIAKQIQNDLLKLDAITHHERQGLSQFELESHAVPLKIVHRQCDDLPRRLVQIHRLQSEFAPNEH